MSKNLPLASGETDAQESSQASLLSQNSSDPANSYGAVSSGSGVVSAPRKRAHLPNKWYIAYYVPSLAWIENYKWEYLPGDIAAGLSLASFQLPITLSYATSLAHVPAVSGCLGLIVPPLIYALLGSVPQMIIGPEAAISLVLGHSVLPYLKQDDHGHSHDGRSDLIPIEVSALVSGSVGAIILVMGLLRFGFLESVMSQSLLRGFVTGVGIVMVVDQLPSELGMAELAHREMRANSSSFERLLFILDHANHIKFTPAIFAATALVAMMVIRAVKSRLMARGYTKVVVMPDILLVVIVSTFVCYYWRFDQHGLAIVGDVKPGKFELQWSLRPKFWQDFRINFNSSFFIAILGFLETTVAARSLGSTVGTPDTLSSANRELVALGSANLAGMIFGALPSFGGYGRSKINVLSGAKTQLAAVIMSIVTLTITVNFLGYLYFLPQAILSSIISLIGLSLLEEAPADIIFYLKVRGYSDLATAVASSIATFFWSVEAGVGVGVLIAVTRVLHHATRPRIQILTRQPGTHRFVNADDMPDMPPGTMDLDSGILVVKIPEPLTFANSGDLSSRLRRLELHGTAKAHPGRPRTKQEVLHHVVFHLSGMTQFDPSAAATLAEIIESYITRGITVLISELSPKPEVRERFENAGLRALIENQDVPQTSFDKLRDAVASFEDTS